MHNYPLKTNQKAAPKHGPAKMVFLQSLLQSNVIILSPYPKHHNGDIKVSQNCLDKLPYLVDCIIILHGSREDPVNFV